MKLYALLLALGAICPAYSMGRVSVRHGRPGDLPACSLGTYCYDAICDYYELNGNKWWLDPYQSGEPYFAIEMPDGGMVSVPIPGPCAAHNMCYVCGENGECAMEGNEPVCECDEGYSGDYCEKDEEGGDQNLMIALTVLGVVVALFIIIAIIAHLCWKKGAHGGIKRVVKVPRQHVPCIDATHMAHSHCAPVCKPALPAIAHHGCGCGGHVNPGFAAPSCAVHSHPSSSVRVSEIADNGVVNGLNTFVVGNGHGYNSVDNVTRYTTQSRGPTVITNMPAGAASTFAPPSIAVLN